MRIERFSVGADLVGRRARVAWHFVFATGEGLADIPPVRVRRKLRDFQFPELEPGQTDPFLVYDSDKFPSPGTVVAELPHEERVEAGQRVLTTVTTLSRSISGRPMEILRRTVTTRYHPGGAPERRAVEILDLGDSIGGLAAGTPYYYQLFASSGLNDDRSVQAIATPGECHGLSRAVYDMLPGIHRRHDTVARPHTPGAEAIPEASIHAGQLRRFIDVFGTALDLMRSTAEGLRELHDIDRVDARMLPFLARWIGWDLSLDVPIPNQRHQIKYAPALYRLTGTIPSAMIWSRVTSGWTGRVKEFIHNVAVSNRPEELNLWLSEKPVDGDWSLPEAPLVLEHAHRGRPAAAVLPDGTLWLAYHAYRMNRWGIWCKRRDPAGLWSESELISGDALVARNPCVAVTPGGRLWVAWSEYHAHRDDFTLRYTTRSAAGAWSEIEDFGDPDGARKDPAMTVDEDGGVWLFWMERTNTVWHLRYARHHGGAFSAPVDFPDAGGQPVVVAGQISVIAFSAAGDQLRVFFARPMDAAALGPGQTRSTLAYRGKSNLLADASGWGSVRELSATPPTYHESDPAAFVDRQGALELIFSSTRAQGWSLWRRVFDADNDSWSPAEPLPATAYNQRHPQPVLTADALLLLYRSNQSPVYQSAEPGGVRSVDFRHAGATTVHVGYGAKNALFGTCDDFSCYTIDTGERGQRDEGDIHGLDTYGLYLAPDTVDADKQAKGKSRVRQVMRHFVPVSKRAVLLTEPTQHTEYVYDFHRPGVLAPRLIHESFADALDAPLVSEALEDGLDFADELG